MRTNRNRRPRIALTGYAASCLAAGALLAGPAVAQEDWEYEADEGYHEEEWYDPSDWFNDDEEISYESDYGDYTEDSYLYDDDVYGVDYYGDTSGYWDGYYDGYYDSEFGYDDWSSDWDATYQTTFSDGYYDGYYDQEQGYGYDPYWYTTTDDQQRNENRNREDARKRSQDQMRERGDRVKNQGSRADRAGNRGQQQSQQKSGESQANREMTRVRGTADSITQVERNAPDDHIVLRVQFEDQEAVVADFGPKMTRDDMPIQKGEKVTLVGDRRQRNGREVLVVCKIVEDGKTHKLRSHGKEKGQQRANQRGNMRWDESGNMRSNQNRDRSSNGNR